MGKRARDLFAFGRGAGARRVTEKSGVARRMLGISALFVLVFFLMLLYLGGYALTQQRRLFGNAFNTRPAMLSQENLRGTIYAADGSVLAKSEENAAGEAMRVYPYGRLFSHIVGFVGYGKSGLEDAEDYDLVRSHIDLSKKAAYQAEGALCPGNAVVTSLSPVLQQAAYDALGSTRGAVVVTEVGTGRILAMVSKPDFDPATIREDWDGYVQDPKSGVLLNRATQGLYAPGSTFKIVDAMTYLTEHSGEEAFGTEAYHYHCTGSLSYSGGTIHCFHNQVHGDLDFRSSLARSCNASFAHIGEELKESSLRAMLRRLYFNRSLPYLLPLSASSATLPRAASDEERIQLSIGQGETLVTPLHLNLITAAIAGDGTLMQPTVVDRVETAEGKPLQTTMPKSLGRVLSKEQAALLRDLLREVVLTGTATQLQNDRYTAAGKTGSAEYDPADPTKSHAWFTGFAPAEDPKICVTVLLEGAGSGGGMAVPAAKLVLDAYFE